MLKVAQIGIGYWGPNLLRNLVNNKNISVMMVSDKSAERRAFVNNKYPDITVTDNNDLIFKSSDIDAVVIATPVISHFDLSMQALRSGKHVLVEKPMASKVKDVRQIGDLAKKNDLNYISVEAKAKEIYKFEFPNQQGSIHIPISRLSKVIEN